MGRRLTSAFVILRDPLAVRFRFPRSPPLFFRGCRPGSGGAESRDQNLICLHCIFTTGCVRVFIFSNFDLLLHTWGHRPYAADLCPKDEKHFVLISIEDAERRD